MAWLLTVPLQPFRSQTRDREYRPGRGKRSFAAPLVVWKNPLVSMTTRV